MLFFFFNFAEICSHRVLVSDDVGIKTTYITGDNKTFQLNQAYCDKTKLKYNLPAAVFANKGSYDLFH